jgi:rod shape-determining protein MreC
VIRLPPPRRAFFQRVTFSSLVALSAMMVVLEKADQIAFESLRISVSDAVAPTLDALSRPLAVCGDLLDRALRLAAVYRENARLSQENERLLKWQQAALSLAAENVQLRGLLKLGPEPAVSYVTARVIADSGGAYVRSLMVNAGSETGVTRGQAAVTGEGLVGRVAEVGRRAARVLLVTDLNSRVPVIVDGSRQRAVMAGDNSERPRLQYAEAGVPIRIGDRIITSGQGGVFAPGLPVGVVATVEDGPPRIELYVDLSRVEYLRIVDYGLTEGLPKPIPLAQRNGKRADPSAGDPSARH